MDNLLRESRTARQKFNDYFKNKNGWEYEDNDLSNPHISETQYINGDILISLTSPSDYLNLMGVKETVTVEDVSEGSVLLEMKVLDKTENLLYQNLDYFTT